MAKKKKLRQPFKAQSMATYASRVHNQQRHRDAIKTANETSAVTIYKPDDSGELVAVEVVDPDLYRNNQQSQQGK